RHCGADDRAAADRDGGRAERLRRQQPDPDRPLRRRPHVEVPLQLQGDRPEPSADHRTETGRHRGRAMKTTRSLPTASRQPLRPEAILRIGWRRKWQIVLPALVMAAGAAWWIHRLPD